MAFGIADSLMFGSAWISSEFRALFDELSRTSQWLEILAALAETQGEFGLIPERAACAVASTCRGISVDDEFLREVAEGREKSGHSTAGLISAIAKRCPETSGEWVYVGATVQDLTDTWTMGALRDARILIARYVDETRSHLQRLAHLHRTTPMVGRTHGQHGLPITFGLKLAGWGSELDRHHERLAAIEPRLGTVQLSGGVGSVSSLGTDGLAVQASFAKRLGMRVPGVSWTSSRDVYAEWCALLALVCGTADRIGREVYNLSRTEVGELSEGSTAAAVSSITMPHKRNPEVAESLGTLARAVRHHAAAVLEGMAHEHERDGRAWKGEWYDLPAATVLGGTAVARTLEMLIGLRVHPDRMARNLEATGGFVCSEAVMLKVAAKTGKQTAHRLLAELANETPGQHRSFRERVYSCDEIRSYLSDEALNEAFAIENALGQSAAMVDAWIERSRNLDREANT